MRRLFKWLAGFFGIVVVAALAVYALAWYTSNRAATQTFAVNDPPLALSNDPATLAHGEHLFATRGCTDCHGGKGEGRVVFDAGPVIRIVGPNVTPGGVAKGKTADQLGAAIRHAVRSDGTPLMFMPSGDFHEMGDADTAALVAYLQSLPASGNDPGQSEVRPLGRVLYLFGKFPLYPAENLDHRPRTRSAPALAATAEYGKYLAQGCTGCHGADLAGQHVPGTPPEFPNAANLTPAGLAGWTQADFRNVMRTGKRPDGRALNDLMPWRTFSQMKDEEIDALWAHISTLPPTQRAK